MGNELCRGCRSNERKIFTVKPFNWKAIVNFVLPNSLPQLIEFEQKLVSRIISARKGALFVILNSNSEKYNYLKEIAKAIASEYHPRSYVVIVDAAIEANENILNILQVDQFEIPCLRYSPSWRRNYIPRTDEINEIGIRLFLEDALASKAKRITWRKSENIPRDWNSTNVSVLVGKNFYETVSRHKFSLVQFYKPYCSKCEKASEVLKQLGEILKDNNDIMIAKMDAEKNEVDNIWVNSYPTIYLYKFSPLDGYKFHGSKTVEELISFLKRHGLKIDLMKDQKEEL